MAAETKHERYTKLEKSYIFQPISFETLGPINSSGHSFICELSRRIAAISGELRATAFLYQRLSITVQRFSAVCLFVNVRSALFADVVILLTWTRNNFRFKFLALF